MDDQGVLRFALIASLLLLVQAGVPTAWAHSDDHGGGAGGEGGETGANETSNETAFRLTPDREFVEQLNPHMSGDRVVWQERPPGTGEDWDIMMANLSGEEIQTRALTNTDHDEKRPVIEDHRVAWTVFPEEDPDNENLIVLDLHSGRIHHVPDYGNDERWPTFGGNGSLYYTAWIEGEQRLRGYNPATGKVFAPIGERSVTGEPAAHGDKLAWATGTRTSVKFHIKDTSNGSIERVPGIYNLQDGPAMGEAGLAWIARYGGQFSRGDYATLYNETTGVEKFESKVYPHTNVGVCPTGVIWDQPGTATTDSQAVALWDRFVDGTVTFGAQAHSGTCGGDHVVYEVTVQGQDGSEGTRQLFAHDLREVRLHRDAMIKIDDRDRRSILRSIETLSGIARSADPREPIQRVLATVDGGQLQEINTTRTEEGLAWKAQIDPRPFQPGRHKLQIVVLDELNRPTKKSFTFYTETPYDIDPASTDGPQVPREDAAPFPLNLINHYQDHRSFYNTVILVLLILAGIAWYVYRRLEEKEVGQPEYVPPEEPEV